MPLITYYWHYAGDEPLLESEWQAYAVLFTIVVTILISIIFLIKSK